MKALSPIYKYFWKYNNQIKEYRAKVVIELEEIVKKRLEEHNVKRRLDVMEHNAEKDKLKELNKKIIEPNLIESTAINNILSREGSYAYVSGAHCQKGKYTRIFTVKPMILRQKRQREDSVTGGKRKRNTKRRNIKKNHRKSRQVRK